MMFENNILLVKSVDIADIISQYVDLKQKGANLLGCCPFHDEKTPSFTVNKAKQYYKCFGCGASGDSISFVQNYEKVEFHQAIEIIAKSFNIKLEKNSKKEDLSPIKKNNIAYSILKSIHTVYSNNIPNQAAYEYLIKRGFSKEDIEFWGIGYVSNNIGSGWCTKNNYLKEALETGIIKDKDGRLYDYFYNRVVFPIRNLQGQICGFGGRVIEADKKPKYINSEQSAIYDKSQLLYGLYESLAGIKKLKCATLVEGYTDVIALHRVGLNNAVATCGTALTPKHAKIISRFTDKVILMRDGDIAGHKAILKDTKILLDAGINVCVYELADGIDPDDFAKGIGDIDEIIGGAVDAVEWIASKTFTEDIAGKPRKTADAVKTICEYLLVIKDVSLRETYIVNFCDGFPSHNLTESMFEKHIDKTVKDSLKKEKTKVEREFTQIDEEKGLIMDRVPEDSINEYYRWRFFERTKGIETGLWFPNQESGDYNRLTNFVLKPLYHLISPDKNVRLVEAIGFDMRIQQNFTNIIELQSNEMLTRNQFATKLFDVGPYLLESKFSNIHLTKLNSRLAFDFRKAIEITSLGWQEEGFWAFANKAWKDTLLDYDRFGIVQVGNDHFLSPSASEMHKDEKDSVYENDKMHSFLASNETFQSWSKQIMLVYGDNGYALISFALMTVFVDVVKKYTEAPLWYCYGPKESGKSTLAKSLQTLFFHDDLTAFNLSTASTDYAFFNRLERFNNCPAVFNEFDEYAIKEDWFRAFKAVYDSEGRERGRGIKGKTHIQKVRASVVIVGQYLTTKDDNSVLSRTIPSLVKPKLYNEEDTSKYNALKKMERQGLTSIIIEILQHRQYFIQNFKKIFDEIFAQMREELKKREVSLSGRMLKNYATITAVAVTLSPKLALPFTNEQLINYSLSRVEEISSTMSESNALSDFWKTVEYLVDRNQIVEGADYRIRVDKSVKIYKDRTTKVDINFEEPTKILYIRIPVVFREYARVVSQITKGKGLNEQTLNTYLKEQPYYIGTNPGMSFAKTESNGDVTSKVTSSLALKYDLIGVSLEKSFDEEEDNRTDETFKATIKTTPTVTSSGKQLLFSTEHTIQKEVEGEKLPKTIVLFTRCYIAIDPRVQEQLKEGLLIELQGKVTHNRANGKTYRNMDVESYKLLEAYTHNVTASHSIHQNNDSSQLQIGLNEPF